MTRSPYDHNWRKVRLMILQRDEYRCYFENCDRLANTVDHIVPWREAPSLRLEPSNLRASCPPHNSGRAQRRAALIAKAIDAGSQPRRQW